jgi:hypothetical protein
VGLLELIAHMLGLAAARGDQLDDVPHVNLSTGVRSRRSLRRCRPADMPSLAVRWPLLPSGPHV